MTDKRNGQFPPCYICGQDVRKVHGPANREGPLCSKPCSQAYFIALQIAALRAALMGQQKPQIVLPS